MPNAESDDRQPDKSADKPAPSQQQLSVKGALAIALIIATPVTGITALIAHRTNQTYERKTAAATLENTTACQTALAITAQIAADLENTLNTCSSDDCCTQAEKASTSMYFYLGKADTQCSRKPIERNPHPTQQGTRAYYLVTKAQSRFRALCLRTQGLSPREIKQEEHKTGDKSHPRASSSDTDIVHSHHRGLSQIE